MLTCTPRRLAMLECRFNKTTHHPVNREQVPCAASVWVDDISVCEQVFWIADAGCRAMTLLKPPTVRGPLRGPKHQEGLDILSLPRGKG